MSTPVKDCLCVTCNTKWLTTYSWVKYCPFCSSSDIKARTVSLDKLPETNLLKVGCIAVRAMEEE